MLWIWFGNIILMFSVLFLWGRKESLYPRLAWNLLCTWGWPRTPNLSASTFSVLILSGCQPSLVPEVPGMEHRALSMIHKHSTKWATLPGWISLSVLIKKAGCGGATQVMLALGRLRGRLLQLQWDWGSYFLILRLQSEISKTNTMETYS